MNRPDPTRPDRDALWWIISLKASNIGKWNFDTILIQVINFCFQNLESISFIVWKLCTFRQRNHFGNFYNFFRLSTETEISNLYGFNGKIWSISIRIYHILNFFKYFLYIKINFRRKIVKNHSWYILANLHYLVQSVWDPPLLHSLYFRHTSLYAYYDSNSIR